MPIGTLFWFLFVLLFLALIAGFFVTWAYMPAVVTVLVLACLGLLGWKTFGPVLQP